MRVLLITVAVKASALFTSLRAVDERLHAYIESFLRWMCVKEIDAIVICNNSGKLPLKKELVEISKYLDKTMEILEFEGNFEEVRRKGKGYGEGEIIKYALSNSRILEKAKSFFKITGKLYVENFGEIVNKIDYKLNYCNMRRMKLRQIRKNNIVDTRFYYIQKQLYEEFLLNEYKKVDDSNGIYLEHLFEDVIKGNNLKFCRFPEYPRITGISGSSGNYIYENNVIFFVKNILYKMGFYSC